MQKPFFILFMDLGLGGVQRKVVDIVNYLADYQPNLPIYILLRKKTEFDISGQIKNKNVRIVNYLDWAEFKIPFFFPVFVFYQVWRLKPQAILAFLNYVSLPTIWAKILFFWRKIRVVLSEDYFTSRMIALQRFALLRHLSVRLFYPLADAVFTCTRATKKDLMISYGIPEKKIRVIRNWTSFINKKIAKLPKKYDLIYTGRLAETKNLIFLLRGVKKLKKYKPNIKLCIVGDGEEQKRLEKFTKKNRLEGNVAFVGTSHRVEEFLNQSKIFVFSPKAKVEGFSLSILEAMALRIPVLTRDFAGAKEFLADGKNCYFFKTEKEFIKKAFWLLSHPEERKKIAAQARQYVKKYHSPQNILDYLEELELAKKEEK